MALEVAPPLTDKLGAQELIALLAARGVALPPARAEAVAQALGDLRPLLERVRQMVPSRLPSP